MIKLSPGQKHFKQFQETMYAKTRSAFIFVKFHDSMLKCSLNESFHLHFEDMNMQHVWIFYQTPHVIPFEVNFEAAPCAGNSRELRLQAMRGHARLAWPGENTVEIATINAMQVQVVKLRDMA